MCGQLERSFQKMERTKGSEKRPGLEDSGRERRVKGTLGGVARAEAAGPGLVGF